MPLKSLILEYSSQSSMTQPDFFASALKAVKNAPENKRKIVINDIAEQLGCDSSDLKFLFDVPNWEEDFAVPEYRDVLLAAE